MHCEGRNGRRKQHQAWDPHRGSDVSFCGTPGKSLIWSEALWHRVRIGSVLAAYLSWAHRWWGHETGCGLCKSCHVLSLWIRHAEWLVQIHEKMCTPHCMTSTSFSSSLWWWVCRRAAEWLREYWWHHPLCEPHWHYPCPIWNFVNPGKYNEISPGRYWEYRDW